MKILHVLFSILGILIILLGLVFMIAASEGNTVVRLIIGACMIVTGGFLMIRSFRRSPRKQVTIRQKLELSGNVNLEEMRCSQCGGGLSSEHISVRAGAVFVSCPFCKSEYQIEEEPKW